MPPNLTNGRMHWRTLHRKRTEFYAACDAKQLTGELPPPPTIPFLRATASVTMYLGSEMDDENCAARTKWCFDWLKTRGYILDDRRKNLYRSGFPVQRIKRDKNYRVEVSLTELAALPREKSA
jgi:hypothetical protein